MTIWILSIALGLSMAANVATAFVLSMALRRMQSADDIIESLLEEAQNKAELEDDHD